MDELSSGETQMPSPSANGVRARAPRRKVQPSGSPNPATTSYEQETASITVSCEVREWTFPTTLQPSLAKFQASLPSLAGALATPHEGPKPFVWGDYERWARSPSRRTSKGVRLSDRTIKKDRQALAFLAKHAVPVDLDNEETWHAHADHRVNIDKEDESRLERYRKTLWRVQRFRGVHWPSLDEAYQQPNRKRAIPSSELVARLCGPETTLAHHRYTNTLYKHVLHAMFGMGLRPPGEFAVLSLGSVKWTQDSGESFTAQTIYDAAVAGRAHDVERLWGIARQTQGYVTVLQPKKRGKRDYIRGPVPFPAWVLSAPNGRSILNYVVHHRPKIARRPGISVTTDRLFIQWNGEDYAGGEDPGHGLANGLARAVKRYWPEYTNYSARHFYATTRLIETYTRDKRFDIYRVAKELGDTVRTVERTYVPQANEILQLAAENAVNKRFRGKR